MGAASGFFTMPTSNPLQLSLSPRLASWNSAEDPDQMRLAAALDDASSILLPHLNQTHKSMTLRLDVGLAPSVPLLSEHDLDNYAYPMARHLEARFETTFASVWCTKKRAAESFVRVEPATAATDPANATVRINLGTTASASTPAYKQQIHDQLEEHYRLPEGPISLEIAFTVGPRRNWLNLWKPTIDALEKILGRTGPDRAWHPRDGRITTLGLHRTVHDNLGNDVNMAIRASAIPEPPA